jgi:hypothetical protein
MVETGSAVLHRIGGGRAGEVAVQRYLASPHVTPEGIVETLSARTQGACLGRRVVAVQDTTEINFAGRSAARRGLGPGGDGSSPGFFIHPVVAVDADDEAVLGLVHAQIWTRRVGRVASRRRRPLEEKESARWVNGSRVSAERLAGAAQVIGVSDREGDVYAHFVRRPAGLDLIVRAAQDRALAEGGLLSAAPHDWNVLLTTTVRVAPRGPGDRGRTATVALRAGPVRLKRPSTAERCDAAEIELGLIEARETDAPAGVKPLSWLLLTTLPVTSPENVAEVVRLYRLRWRIEQVFRALKSEGLHLEGSQVHEAERLFRLSALALGAAVRTLQLVDARDGSRRPMSDVLDADLVEVVAVIGRTKEGATARQKNPHPKGSLAWLAWIVARFGAWTCYGKPPGPKTMATGWNAFEATLTGFLIAMREALP